MDNGQMENIMDKTNGQMDGRWTMDNGQWTQNFFEAIKPMNINIKKCRNPDQNFDQHPLLNPQET